MTPFPQSLGMQQLQPLQPGFSQSLPLHNSGTVANIISPLKFDFSYQSEKMGEYCVMREKTVDLF